MNALRMPALAAAALLTALLLAFLASRPPAPKPGNAPQAAFSATRAMTDVREISKRPRPTGSPENALSRSYLAEKMRQLGMEVSEQAAPLPSESVERLSKWGASNAATAQLVNLIGVLPGRDRTKPALLMMAHHDSVWESPGAPDDAAGVAASLEVVRALKARGAPERDVVVLLTDAEEIGLDGAEAFFQSHPLARRTGAVINMEARGGGGRTAMFETGRGNARWIDLYRRSVGRPSSNSLAVLIYELMPNNTDFTIPKKLGLPGFNFAFIGKAELYHSPAATAEALDQGSLQDMGDQALGVAAALAFASELPGRADNAVFGDVLGLFVVAYPAAIGWAILLAAAGLLGLAFARARRSGSVSFAELGGGVVTALAMLAHSALILHVANRISGSAGGPNYYDRLAALPRLESQALLICLACLLLACIVVRPAARLLAAAPAAALLMLGLILGSANPLLLGLALASAVTAILLPRNGASAWGGWLGISVLLLFLGIAVQVAAPTAGPLLHWPLLLAALAAAAASLLDPGLGFRALVPAAVIGAVGGAQLLSLAHFTFQGVGAGLPEAMAVYALLMALLLWPLVRQAVSKRGFTIASLLMLVAAAGLALSVRLDPMAPTVPQYSLKK